jgi:hypothetical protein
MLAVLLVIAVPAPVLALDGNGWLKQSEIVRVAYVGGLVDAWAHVSAVVQETRAERPAYTSGEVEKLLVKMTECLAGKPHRQTMAIIEKYMKDNPGKWHHAMADSAFVAVWAACKE